MGGMPRAGTALHVVKRSWYRQWMDAVQEQRKEAIMTIDTVPPIDNADLVDDHGRFVEVPQAGQNIVVFVPEAYRYILEW
jgi:hypothetical protein